jgi:hypothetical protein
MTVSVTGARRAMVVSAAALFGILLSAPGIAAPIDVPITPVPPPAGEVTIDVATVNGTGCPKDSYAIALSPDKKAFTVTYSEYTAWTGEGSKPLDFRKNCQINVKVNVPGGFTYGIAKADHRGFGQLEAGAKAELQTTLYFQGLSETLRKTHVFKKADLDEQDGYWNATDEAEFGAVVWHPCGEKRLLNANTQLKVTAGKDKKVLNMFTMDSTDGSVTTLYRLAWAKCPK